MIHLSLFEEFEEPIKEEETDDMTDVIYLPELVMKKDALAEHLKRLYNIELK